MPNNAYQVREPDDTDPLWTMLIKPMAKDASNQLARLLDAIDVFAKNPNDRSAGRKIEPKRGHNDVEVYLVPALYDDASALLQVDHKTRTIRFMKIYRQLVSCDDDEALWNEIEVLSKSAAKG